MDNDICRENLRKPMYFKGFDANLRCRDMQYEVGKIYKTDTDFYDLSVCDEGGLHFCMSLCDVDAYYTLCDTDFNIARESVPNGTGGGSSPVSSFNKVRTSNRACIVKPHGPVMRSGNKFCTNSLEIVRELSDNEILFGLFGFNIGLYNTGTLNCGYYNKGHRNTGNQNSGSYNTGYYNSGNFNTGDNNKGERNTGGGNSGDLNTGYSNSGLRNTGQHNSGNYNSGSSNAGNYNCGSGNVGDSNTGFGNSGHLNTGSNNSGHHNSGSYNVGSHNSGYHNLMSFNSGSYNGGSFNSGSFNATNGSSGICNMEEEKIRIFDKMSDYTLEEAKKTEWYKILQRLYERPKAQYLTEIISVAEIGCLIRTMPNFSYEKMKELFGWDFKTLKSVGHGLLKDNDLIYMSLMNTEEEK